MGFKNFWLSLLFGTYNGEIIEAEFTDGQKATYPVSDLPFLQEERRVKEIVSLETGEVYKMINTDGSIYTAYPE